MSFFKYKQFGNVDAANLVIESSKLAIYSNAGSFMGLPGATLLNWFGKIGGNSQANKYHIGMPDNWREVAPHELGLPSSVLDNKGYYAFNSPVFGKISIGAGPQAKIFAKYENGKVSKVTLSVAGTNDLLDVADYLHINSGKVVHHLEPLLDAVKGFVLANGLGSEDVVITGYSLGGALTNLAAKYAGELSGGFFKDSNFVGFASPYVYDNPEMILNLGFENDAVYRFLGNEPTLEQSLKATKPGLVNPDKAFSSTADNMILFDDRYGSPLYNEKLESFALRTSWSAHGQAVRSDAYERMVNSKFYEYMEADDKVVIDQLTAMARWNTWVKDKSSANSGAKSHAVFMFGNENNNLLEGGSSGDYIVAGGGNDKIKTGVGADRIDGGSGIDTLVLKGTKNDWDAYRLEDGTFFVHAKNKTGLTQAENVERVEFQGDILTLTRPYEIGADGLHDSRFLVLKHLNQNIAYNRHVEGSDGDDTLSGKAVFAKDGNDTLKALRFGSLLHGGEGDDVLYGNRGSDELFGAEGNDVLYGSKGVDYLYGGVGNDTFVFKRGHSGHTTIKDFNDYAGDNDKLLFSKSLFSDTGKVLSAMKQQGDNVVIHKYDLHLVLENTQISELHHGNIGIF